MEKLTDIITRENLSKVFNYKGKCPRGRIPDKDIIVGHCAASIEEYKLLGSMCQLQRPKRIFEFGTFEGYSALALALNAPQAQVFTLDLPKGERTTAIK